MPSDRKESISDGRIEEELDERRPLYISALAAFFKAFFFIYDTLVYIPFKIFADPAKKLERSERTKAKPIVFGDQASPWRHVDTIGGELKGKMFEGCFTLGKIWDESVKQNHESLCMGTRHVVSVSQERQRDGRTFQKLILGEYEWLDYAEADEIVNEIKLGIKTMEIKKGTHVVIYAETRKEWILTAIACFKLGLPIVTIYPTLGDEGIAFAMKECDAVAVFTSRGLLPNVLKSIRECPEIKTIIYFSEMHALEENCALVSDELKEQFAADGRTLYSFDTLLELGGSTDQQTSDEAREDVNTEDLAMIMYTSGTTGNPKGVLLSHKNIIAAISAQSMVISLSPSDTYIGYLPLAHILEVCAELVVLSKGCRIGYSSPTTLFDRAAKIQKGSKGDTSELKPTLIACVPAIMDRIFKAVSDEVREKSPIQRELFRICYERKRSRYEEGYSSLVMNSLVFNKIRKILGGSLRYVLSGGAPLNPETQRFMNICFCCPVVQGYGLTETCGGATLADEHDLSTGSVGPPLRCNEILLREWKEAGYSPQNERPQGEILIHGDNVALGYYKNQEKTNEDFITIDDKKRWFATGDIGEFREDGSLCIIDRKKDLIKLSHGEYVSLGKVETSLLTNPNIDNICVYGAPHTDFLIALVVPNQKNLETLAEKNGIQYNSWQHLCQNKAIQTILIRDLGDFANGKLRKEELPKKVYLCAEPWTPASGLLTEALKLKRKNIQEAFKDQIKSLYAE